MQKSPLPPLIDQIADNKVTWKRLEDIDYDLLGYFLSCHLVIEHYIDGYLKVAYPKLNWSEVRHSLGQRVALVSTDVDFDDDEEKSNQYLYAPAVKHLNAMRNKLAHDISFKINRENLEPLTIYLKQCYSNEKEVPTEPKEILSQFTTMVCVLFAGTMTGHLHYVKVKSKT